LPENAVRDEDDPAKIAARSADLVLSYVQLQTALRQVDAQEDSALDVGDSISSARHDYLISKAAYQLQAGRVNQVEKDILGQVGSLDGSLPRPVQIHENAYPSPISVFPRLKDFVGLLALANFVALGLGVGCAVLLAPAPTK
jgi:hypothetical protein